MAPPLNDRGSAGSPSAITDWWYRTRYQFYAPAYRFAARPLEKRRRRAIERIAPAPGERILILGCGPGMDLPHLPREASISALDAGEVADRTRRKYLRIGLSDLQRRAEKDHSPRPLSRS